MQTYPLVRPEEETLRRVLAGASIARYGDGEFKHCDGECNVSQAHDPRLTERLREILVDSGSCMVGIPNVNPDALLLMSDEKRLYWKRFGFKSGAARHLEASRVYNSAFITRPDSAPWINTEHYWRQIESLWAGRDVTLVRGRAREDGNCKSLTAADLSSARTVREVLAPRQHAFAEYQRILEEVGRPERVLICLGPTATVLAVDLSARGVHAIDLGHIALFLRKYRRGEPLTLSKDEKGHEKVRG